MRKAPVLTTKVPSVSFITLRTRWTSVRTQELSWSKGVSSMLQEARETGQAKNIAGRAWAVSRRGEHDTRLCAAHCAASVRESIPNNVGCEPYENLLGSRLLIFFFSSSDRSVRETEQVGLRPAN